jgi:hypothetical protein
MRSQPERSKMSPAPAIPAKKGCPAHLPGRADAPALFPRALRPGIIVAIGGEKHPHLRAEREGTLNEPAGGDRFIVRMRRDDEHPIFRAEGKHHSNVSPKGE